MTGVKKKNFHSFSFEAEYEDNITVEIFVEYEKDKKDFKTAEKEALFFSHMYGQMPHFLKDYNKKIYVHNDNEYDDGLGLWWVSYKKREFHINAPRYDMKPSGDQLCGKSGRYSHCAVVMVHELAHVIQQLTGVISPSKWAKARKLDKKKYVREFYDNKLINVGSVVYEYLHWLPSSFITQEDPTTFKKLIFKKEKNITTSNSERRGDLKKNKTKLFRGFIFEAEYEDNITVEIFVEYEKDKKDFEKAEKEALIFSRMFGQMPHFLKIYTDRIYVHKTDKGANLWWVMYNKREFHLKSTPCRKYFNQKVRYSRCAVIMAHELSHILQQLTGVISPSKWGTARKLDKKKYCSKYAKTNSKEDFAESVICWIASRHKSNRITQFDVKKINYFIPNRLKFFDEMNFNMYPM